MYQQRGLSSSQEQASAQLIRDVRPLGQRVKEFLAKPINASICFAVMVTTSYSVPGLSDFMILGILGLYLFAVNQIYKLPFRLPKRSHAKDYNDLNPVNKPNEAGGIYHFGNEKSTQDELWFNNDDMRTHVLIFGSTGSGKTELMLGLAYNALVQSSGFIYVDGKGDNSIYAKIFSMVRYMGREDDFLVINFMTGARDIIGPQEKRMSNTLNPFATGSSSMLSNLISGLMDSSSGSSDGDMWKGRAIAFIEALMKVLVAMRDSGHILLDANTIRNYFALERIEAMVVDKTFIRDGQYAISMDFLPELVMQPLNNYLFTLPGYNKERKGKQVSQVFEQHGYITMQLTRQFSSLADTYGHILRTKLAEVDLKDVVLNRRIMTVLLPALEKSPDELANLGRIIISSLRVVMSSGLGDAVEGTFDKLITSKPTNSPSPYLCILDEYGYYAVKGFAVVPAQARSLGFSIVFGGQDLPAFQKASKEEAASIGANTNIKICMKLEDPTETWDFFMKGAAESYVTMVDSFSANPQGISNAYQDTRSAKTEKRARIDLLDLKEQAPGEMHIFFKSKIVRARCFFANPPPVKSMRLNQLLKVDLPKDVVLYEFVKALEDLQALEKKNFAIGEESTEPEIQKLVDQFEKHKDCDDFIEAGTKIILDDVTVSEEKPHIDANQADTKIEDVDIDTSFGVFSRVSMPESLKKVFSLDDYGPFEEPVISKNAIREDLEFCARLMGMDKTSASESIESLLKKMQASTQYPEPDLSKIDVPQIIEAIDKVKSQINESKEKS
ncbi:MAG: phosphoesterase [Legionellales bacterium]|nr:phosphoesterase [Legionellales bacterium]OUX67728.1 MAG: phosphoesterase [bacterium TMED178]|tara:strand:- start:14352 stop:16703 length:2352 start_codon:yes stop_codon:yes gene_type:complete